MMKILLRWRTMALLLWALSATPSHATYVNVTLETGSLSATPGVLTFDLIDGDGGPPHNTVDLSAIASTGGTQSSATVVFATVLGTGPWTFVDTGFPELKVTFDPLGTQLTFSFLTTDYPQNPGTLFPDQFALVLLDQANNFLVTTDEPFGTNALFTFDFPGENGLIEGESGLKVFTATGPDDFKISATSGPNPTAAVPEPQSLVLLFVGAAAALATKRKLRSAGQRQPKQV